MDLGVVRSVSYGLWGPPDEFVPQARAIGAGLVRAYVYWGQVEPRPGEFDWTVVDALLGQLDDEEVWLTVCASSPWATREATTFLPPSPAKDVATYRSFVSALVGHCGGRIRYWQCDNEPSNIGLTWAGTADEYVVHLRAMHEAVKEADSAAQVVLGGCGYDVLSTPAGSPQREFFARVLETGRDHLDLFDVHLYGDPAAIPAYVADVRAMMGDAVKPVVAGELGGPVPFEFPSVEPVVHQVMGAAFGSGGSERDAMLALYAAADLPDRLRMFLADCPAPLEEKRMRIACRQVVTRTLLALACGVERTVYWHLAPETPGEIDPYQLMGLMFGKLAMFAYEDRALTRRLPTADTFASLARHLAGVSEVTLVDGCAVRLGETLVCWAPGDPFDGEDERPVPDSFPWSGSTATAEDVFGKPVEVAVRDGRVHVARSVTPVFVTV